MPKRKKPTRVFTSADIQAFFEWVNAVQKERHPEETHTLQRVSLLPDITPGGWQLDCLVTNKETQQVRVLSLLVIQVVKRGKPDLTYAMSIDLPEGLTSPSEEDVEIERQHKVRLAKWEAERKQENGNHDVSESL